MNYRTFLALNATSKRIARNNALARNGATFAAIKAKHDREVFSRICENAGIDAVEALEQLTKGMQP